MPHRFSFLNSAAGPLVGALVGAGLGSLFNFLFNSRLEKRRASDAKELEVERKEESRKREQERVGESKELYRWKREQERAMGMVDLLVAATASLIGLSRYLEELTELAKGPHEDREMHARAAHVEESFSRAFDKLQAQWSALLAALKGFPGEWASLGAGSGKVGPPWKELERALRAQNALPPPSMVASGTEGAAQLEKVRQVLSTSRQKAQALRVACDELFKSVLTEVMTRDEATCVTDAEQGTPVEEGR